MKKNQFLLLKLAEECVEVAQRASKQIQFGKNEVQKDQQKTNATRLREEILDLFSVVSMLVQEDEIEMFTPWDYDEAREAKVKKLQKYLDLSASLGQLPEIRL
jgi:NTP pyrophosphatase (non-canonical NTP hydrolase)